MGATMAETAKRTVPEPARTLMAAMLESAFERAQPGPWLRTHPVHVASPSARQVLWAVGRRIAHEPDLGFVIAHGVAEEAVGSLWPLYQTAPTLRTLVEHYDSWSALLLEFASYRPYDDADLTWFRTTPPRGIELDRGEQDFRAHMTLKVWRRLAGGGEVAPEAVHFTYPRPRHTSWHERVLGRVELRFSQPSFQLGLRREHADAALPCGDFAVHQRLVALAVTSALSVKRSGPLRQRVESLLIEQLSRLPSQRDIASSLGLSERTLRRKLAESGDSFGALLAGVRRRENELFARAVSSSARAARYLGFANRGALRNWRRHLGL